MSENSQADTLIAAVVVVVVVVVVEATALIVEMLALKVTVVGKLAVSFVVFNAKLTLAILVGVVLAAEVVDVTVDEMEIISFLLPKPVALLAGRKISSKLPALVNTGDTATGLSAFMLLSQVSAKYAIESLEHPPAHSSTMA